MSIRPAGVPFARQEEAHRLISGNKTLVARPTTYLSVPTNNANARATTVGGTVLLYDASAKGESELPK